MLPIFEFIFASFWRWVGFAILLAIVVGGLSVTLESVLKAMLFLRRGDR